MIFASLRAGWRARPLPSLTILGVLATTIGLGACSSLIGFREVTADRIARPAFMIERDIPAGTFHLAAWERVRKPSEDIHLYIEGDGLAWTSRREASRNPTPVNPVALHLAAMDKAPNVAWLGRPCQYQAWTRVDKCPSFYWKNGRFAPEVIAAYHEALDNIKAMNGTGRFHLIGYSGGAAVAALIAAERDDVLSLRTVAGNLDHAVFTALHNVSPMTESLNPVDVAPSLARLPQHHFIGGNDKVVPPAIFHSWSEKTGTTDCMRYTFIAENEHETGWVEKWPDLLHAPLHCDTPAPAPRPKGVAPQDFIDVKKGTGKR